MENFTDMFQRTDIITWVCVLFMYKLYNIQGSPPKTLHLGFLSKQEKTKKCEEHRTISRVLNIVLNIVHTRIYSKLKDNILKFGFRNGFGTKDGTLSSAYMF